MPIPAHVSLDFKRFSVPDKISFGENVIDQLTSNATTFPDLPVSLITLTATNTALRTAQTNAASGDHQEVAVLHAQEETWSAQFEDTADYVDTVAEGDVADILLAGFHSTKTERTPVVIPDSPVLPKVLTNQWPGGIHVEIEPQKGVKFIVIVSTDATLPDFAIGQFLLANNPKVIAIIFDSGRKVDIGGLPVRAAMFVSAIAINSAGFSPASPPMAANTL